MLFNEFGEKGKKVILCMHGMCQDWHSVYERVKSLEKEFRIIIPAMDGFNDKSNGARRKKSIYDV